MDIYYGPPDNVELAQRLAEQFSLSLQNQLPEGPHFQLSGNQLSYVDSFDGQKFEVVVDFEKAQKRFQSQQLSKKKDSLSRALGLPKQDDLQVLDVTLGLGKDAFHMAYLGARVTAVEKQAYVFALVQNALERFPMDNLQIVNDDALSFLGATKSPFDVLYYDPMFTEVDKKSRPKKEMVFLRQHSSKVMDIEPLISAAQTLGIKRMVVKRPLKGEQLHRDPKFTVRGKMVRYDVYILKEE